MTSTNPFGEAYKTVQPTTLQVCQKYWSWFSNTGRGFSISRSDGSTLFVVSTTSMGKRRIFQDHLGQPLFDLERNFSSNRGAFVATRAGSEVLRVKYSWVHRKIRMEVTLSVEVPSIPGNPILVEADDTSGSSFSARVGSEVVMIARCTNISKGPLSSLKVTPPEWAVEVASGIDLALASLITVCISDAFSEAHFLML